MSVCGCELCVVCCIWVLPYTPFQFSPQHPLPPTPSPLSRVVLVTTIMLDHDLMTPGTKDYRLTVTVNDTENAASLIVNIHVVDINDNEPVFENTTYDFSICENLPVGSIVGAVTAADRDSGTFGEVQYSLSGPGSEKLVSAHSLHCHTFTCVCHVISTSTFCCLQAIDLFSLSSPLFALPSLSSPFNLS